MSEHPRPKLPAEPAYWDRLAAKVNDDAAGPLAAYRAAAGATATDDASVPGSAMPPVWYDALSRRAPWLVAASVVATLVIWLALPPDETSVVLRWMEDALFPDEVAGALVGGSTPPGIDRLMAEFPPGDGGSPR